MEKETTAHGNLCDSRDSSLIGSSRSDNKNSVSHVINSENGFPGRGFSSTASRQGSSGSELELGAFVSATDDGDLKVQVPDKEDIYNLDDDTRAWRVTSNFVPRLVFIDPQESGIPENTNSCSNRPRNYSTASVEYKQFSLNSLPNRATLLDGLGNREQCTSGDRESVGTDNHFDQSREFTPVLHGRTGSMQSQQSSDSDFILNVKSDEQEMSERNPNGYELQLTSPAGDVEDSGDDLYLEDVGQWHCHALSQARPKSDRLARNQLVAVCVLCTLFMIGEAVGGALSNSLALFTDVLHLGSDLISFLISLLAIYLSTKPPTRRLSFGYHRAEVLGALFSVFIIWMVTGVLCYMAIERIVHKHYMDVKPDEMLVTAVIGVVFNVIMGFVLHSEMCHCKHKASFGHSHGHSHGHGHSHSHSNGNPHSHSWHHHSNHSPSNSRHRNQSNENRTEEEYQSLVDNSDSETETTSCEAHDAKPPRHKNINVRAAFIHVLGDIIQSIGVLIASLIIKFTTDEKFRLADPICTFLFSLLVILTTITVLRDTLSVIMEGVPRDIDYKAIRSSLLKLDGVKTVHSLNIWCLTIDRNALAVHLTTAPDHDQQKVLAAASDMLQQQYNFYHTTVQVEDYLHDIMTSCDDCLGPS